MNLQAASARRGQKPPPPTTALSSAPTPRPHSPSCRSDGSKTQTWPCMPFLKIHRSFLFLSSRNDHSFKARGNLSWDGLEPETQPFPSYTGDAGAQIHVHETSARSATYHEASRTREDLATVITHNLKRKGITPISRVTGSPASLPRDLASLFCFLPSPWPRVHFTWNAT